MVDIPKADLSNPAANSFSSIGSRFQARNDLRASGIGEGMRRLLYATTSAADTYKKAKENADREYWVQQDRLIDEVFVANGKENQANPEAFKERAAKDKEKLMKNVPDDKQEKFSLIFEEKMNGYNHAVVVNRVNLDYNRQFETFSQESDNLRRQAYNATINGDQAGYAAATQKWQENEEYLYTHGFISYREKNNRLKDFVDGSLVQQNLGNARKLFGNSEQLNGYLQKIEKSSSYLPEQKKSIKNSILSEYNTWEATNRVAAKETLQTADFGIKAYAMGIEPQGFDFEKTLEDLKAQGQNDKAAALQEAYDDRKAFSAFARLAPAQMATEIEEMKKSATNTHDLSKIKTFEALAAQSQKEIEADPLEFAVSHGVVENEAIDFENPQSIANRRRNALIIQEKYGLDYAPVATRSEIKNISRRLQSVPAESQAGMLAAIYDNFGSDAETIFAQIAPENPEFAQAADIYADNPEAAARVLSGTAIAREQPEYTPATDTAFNEAFYQKIDAGTFSEMSPEWTAGLKKTVKASLAAQNKNSGLTDRSVNADNFDAAFGEVVGNIVSLENDGSGYVWDNHFKVPAPAGVAPDDFENWWRGLKDKNYSGAVTMSGVELDGRTLMTAGTLHFVGKGRYRVKIDGELVYKNGRPLVLEYGED